MITTFILTIIYYWIVIICLILPTFQIWPKELLTGLSYFFSKLAELNYIFPIETFFQVLLFFITFETLFFTAKLIMKIFNYLRGTGSGLDL